MKRILFALWLSLTLILAVGCGPKSTPHTHTVSHVEENPATCTAKGNIEYWTCTECGKYYSDAAFTTEITDKTSVVIEAAGHGTVTHTEAKRADCFNPGNIEYWECNLCHKAYKDEALTDEVADKLTLNIPALLHADGVLHHEAKTADCYEDGNTEYFECTLCDRFYSDMKMTLEITDKASVVIPATSHSGTVIHREANSPDCYNEGNREYWECSSCNNYFSDALCVEIIIDKSSVIIPATAHLDTLSHHAMTPAGCYTEGNTEYWSCSLCDKFFSEGLCINEITDKSSVIISATAHNGTVSHRQYKDSDCYNKGNTEYFECTECGNYFSDVDCLNIINDKSTVVIAPKAHGGSVVYHEQVGATCTTAGNKEYYECTECLDYFSDALCTVKITDKSTVIIEIKLHRGNLTYHPEKPNTCLKSGTLEYWICDDCGLYYSDADGLNRVTNPSSLYLAPTGEHSYGDDYTCDVCGTVYEPYKRVSSWTVEFGEYPQYMVDPAYSTALYNKLCALVEKPTDKDAKGWTSYGYYKYNNVANYMWYIDITVDGAKYRGVYLSEYRPISIGNATTAGGSCQDEVGIKLDCLYWFEYATLSWSILKEEDGKALLLCQTIIDAQNYYIKQTTTSNNYAESSIRAWLNDSFYNTAFNEMQRAIIQLTKVDNSASTTANATNKYACADTNDYIFLPSYQDMTNVNYGFSSSASNKDVYRLFKATHYAYCMGAFTTSTQNGTMSGDGSFILRSPDASSSVNVCYVNGYYGTVNTNGTVTQTSFGIVPMIWIVL